MALPFPPATQQTLTTCAGEALLLPYPQQSSLLIRWGALKEKCCLCNFLTELTALPRIHCLNRLIILLDTMSSPAAGAQVETSDWSCLRRSVYIYSSHLKSLLHVHLVRLPHFLFQHCFNWWNAVSHSHPRMPAPLISMPCFIHGARMISCVTPTCLRKPSITLGKKKKKKRRG